MKNIEKNFSVKKINISDIDKISEKESF